MRHSIIADVLHMAPKGDMAAIMANAPLTPADADKAPKAQAVSTPKADTSKPPMPTASFALVANFKAYPDKNDASKSNGRVAHVNLTQGIFTCEASIYLETKIEQRPDGRFEDKTLRFSLPKGVKLLDGIDSRHVDTWKDGIVDGFIAWQKASGANLVTRRQAAGTRKLEADPAIVTPAA